jgi:hypothetical protein
MPLFQGTQEQYYSSQQSFTIDSTIVSNSYYTLTFDPLPTDEYQFQIFINDVEVSRSLWAYTATGVNAGRITFSPAPTLNDTHVIRQVSVEEDLGNYQYITLKDAVNNFLFSYVGQDKLIGRVKRADVLFHAQRCIQELSYDTLRSQKSQEIDVPPNLKMKLPHDYVNYQKVSFIDSDGVEKILYPARKTSNPHSLLQDNDYNYLFDDDGSLLEQADSTEWARYQANSGSSNTDLDIQRDINDFDTAEGKRYGLSPENAQVNGVYYIDQYRGYIHFSSTLSGKLVVLHYISDGVGTEDEKIVHKFAEEALYKWIAHGILSTRINIPEYVIARFKKERFAAIRQAKLRLSNLKVEELAQVMRGKSKFIKH